MGHDLTPAAPQPVEVTTAAERLAEVRERIASGERFLGPVASAFYSAVHAVDPTATEDTLATLVGNRGIHLYDSLVAWASLVAGERVLDVGCGSGGAARSAARIVGPTGMVVGVDPCRTALDVARDRAPEDVPMAFVNASAERMVDVPDRGFDCVIASLSLEEMSDLPTALKEIHRVLRPGGRFVASVSDFDRFRPVDASFMGTVIATITRRAPAALRGRATRASIPQDPDDLHAFAQAGLLVPEERDVQLAAIMDDIDSAWAILGRTHMAYLLDEEGQAELRSAIARRLPHTLYFPLRFLRSRRPG